MSEFTKRLPFTLLRLLPGGVFIFSSAVKLYEYEPFEVLLVKTGLSSWGTAPILANSIIAIELIIGLWQILREDDR